MNKTFIKTGTALLLVSSISLPIMATQDFLEVDSFEGIELGTAMTGKVVCGSQNTVTLKANKKTLDNIEVTVKGSHLEISRIASGSNILNNIFGDAEDKLDNSISVVIETSSPLSNIVGSTGSVVRVDKCAVNSGSIKVEAGTGANIKVEGSTGTLDLELSTGSVFNSNSTEFTVDTANVDMSTGSEANLCGASTITGSASTGAGIRASEDARTNDVNLSFGGKINKNNCR
jgi:hypothetical protein